MSILSILLYTILIDVNVDYFNDKWYNSGKERKYYEKYKSILIFSFDEEDRKMWKTVLKKKEYEIRKYFYRNNKKNNWIKYRRNQ